jgi:arylsulfatase A-like enzyme
VLTGLVEGAESLGFQAAGWLSAHRTELAVSADIIWAAVLVNVVFFAAVGVAVLVLLCVFPALSPVRVSVVVLTALAWFDWLCIPGFIDKYAIAILSAGLAAVVMRRSRGKEAAWLRLARRSLPWLAAVPVLVILGISGWGWLREEVALRRLPAVPPDAPRVLVIVVDTLRADHLTSYGASQPLTPNIDRLAREGVTFENAISTSSWTLPSHASLLTGRYPYEHRALLTWFDGRYPTVAEALRAHGYRTAAFSANTYLFCRARGFGRGFMRFEDLTAGDNIRRTMYGRGFLMLVADFVPDFALGRKQADEVNRSLLRWVDSSPGRPFFAFLNYFDVHDPGWPSPVNWRWIEKQLKDTLASRLLGREQPVTPTETQAEIEAYDREIGYVDDNIGRLLNELSKRGLAENLVLALTSDHGQLFGEHGLSGHGNALYRPLLHVPLIIRAPGRAPAGLRVDQPVSTAALPATVMDLLGRDRDQMFPGPSLAGFWTAGRERRDWPCPLAEIDGTFSFEPEAPARYGWMKSLISRRWHYILHERFGEQLYDWVQDPEERHNLAGSPEAGPVLAGFRRQLVERLGRAMPGGAVPGAKH